jgi:hypothetical protein
MSKLIPMACLALPGSGAILRATANDPFTSGLTRKPVIDGLWQLSSASQRGIRHQPGFGKPGCVTFADGHKPLFPQPRKPS